MPRNPRVAVICAQNGRNSGMLSVDLAAASYLAGRGFDFEMMMAAPTRIESEFHGKRIGVYHDPAQLAEFTHALFWGDFLNNPFYGRFDFSGHAVAAGLATDRAGALPIWRRLMLPKRRPGLRIASIAGNFQHDFSAMPEDIAQLAEFDLILPRDPFSLKNLAHHLPREVWERLDQGIDAAFLLPPDAKDGGGGLVWSFGRSELAMPERIVATVAEATGLAPQHLGGWLNCPPEKALETLAGLRGRIAGAGMVLTDIYHVAVNALTQGTPVLMLARPDDRQHGTLGDFKKLTLMRMFGRDDWLELIPKGGEKAALDRLPRRAQRVARARPRHFATVRALTDRFRTDLDRFFREG